MRLVAERPEQEAGDDRATVDEKRRAAEQRGAQKRVLSEADIPEHRREGEQRQQRDAARIVEDAAGDGEIGGEARSGEQDKGDEVWQPRQHRAEQQVDRRVEEELVLDAGAGDRLLGREMGRLIVGELRRTGIGQRAGGVEADEISRVGLVERDDPPMRAGDNECEEGEFDREQNRAASRPIRRWSSHEPVRRTASRDGDGASIPAP